MSRTVVAVLISGLWLMTLDGSQAQVVVRFDSLIKTADEFMYRDISTVDSSLDAAERLLANQGDGSKYRMQHVQLLQARIMAYLVRSNLAATKHFIDLALQSTRQFPAELARERDSLNNETYFFRAIYSRDVGKYDDALSDFGRVEEFVKKSPETKKSCLKLFQVTQYQASIYKAKGEPESAISQYKAGIRYYDCYRDPASSPNYILPLTNIAAVYRDIGDKANAEYFFRKAQDGVKKRLYVSPDYKIRNHALIFFHSFAEHWLRNEQLDSAEHYYRQAIPLLRENAGYAHRIDYGLALLAKKRGRSGVAIHFLNAGISKLSAANDKHSPWLSNLLMLMSQVYQEKGDFRTALRYAQEAVNSQVAKIDRKAFDDNANPSLQSVLSKRRLFLALQQKAQIFYDISRKGVDRAWLTKSYETNRLAIQLLDSMRSDFSMDKDKVVLAEETFPVYESGLRIANTLFEKTGDPRFQDEFFTLMEKGRSAVLTDHLKMVSGFSGVPSDVVERQRQINVSLASAEENLFNAEASNQPTSQLEQTLADVKKQQAELNADIKSKYPRYYQLKIQTRLPSTRDLQQNLLSQKQAIIEYFSGDSALYVTAIASNKIITAIVRIDSLPHQVAEIRARIAEPQHGEDADRILNDHLSRLYEQILAPFVNQFDSSVSNLIISPQGALCYLPFEIFPAGDGKFLIDRYSVSYAPSVSVLTAARRKGETQNLFAGFSADYSGSDLPELPGSASELRSIKAVLESDAQVFPGATADDFRKISNQFGILHLAVHSFVNNDKPLFSRLAFSKRAEDIRADITANELYSMEIPAQLVVLSACETGLGQLRKGEGLMSLSRAFMYAGTPSTVISLWKVPDNATSLLMVKFYSFLKLGRPKDEALRLAKVEFRKEYPAFSHPFFWAGFTLNGVTDPIEIRRPLSPKSYYVISISFVLLLVLVLWIRSRTIKQQSAPASR